MGGVCECMFMFVHACMQVYLPIHANKARGCRCWVSSLLFSTFFVCLFSDTVLICSPGWPGTRHVDQATLKLSNVPTFVSQVLELKLCASTPDSTLFWDVVSLSKPGASCFDWLESPKGLLSSSSVPALKLETPTKALSFACLEMGHSWGSELSCSWLHSRFLTHGAISLIP